MVPGSGEDEIQPGKAVSAEGGFQKSPAEPRGQRVVGQHVQGMPQQGLVPGRQRQGGTSPGNLLLQKSMQSQSFPAGKPLFEIGSALRFGSERTDRTGAQGQRRIGRPPWQKERKLNTDQSHQQEQSRTTREVQDRGRRDPVLADNPLGNHQTQDRKQGDEKRSCLVPRIWIQ